MKYIKWKILLASSVVCLLPILLGVSLWDRLPDYIAIHFTFNGEPDNFSTKEFAIFGIPFLMLGFQLLTCIVCDISQKYSECGKLEIASKWIIPVITVVLQTAILGYSLGWDFDMGKVAVILLGGIFIVTGSFIPDYDKVKNFKVDSETARKINRFTGRGMVAFGILFLISAFLPTIVKVVSFFLLILFAIAGTIYGIIISRK